MKKLFKYLKPYTLQCILAPLFKLFEVLLELYVPLVIASIIDSGVRDLSSSFILRRSVMLVAAPLLGFISASTAQYFAANASTEFASAVRQATFNHIQRLSYKDLDSFGTSTLITRMSSDMNQLQQGVNLGLRLLLRSPFVVFGAMIMAFTIDVKSALIFAIAIPLLAVLAFFIILSGMPLIRETQKKLDFITTRTRDNLNGVRVIRALGTEEKEKKDFSRATEALMDAQVISGRVSAFLNPLTSATVNICIAFLVWQGAVSVNKGALSQGQVLALYNYMSQILVELVKLANLVITLSKANAAGERISAVLDTPITERSEDASSFDENSDIAVSFEDVSFSYTADGEAALEGITFSVPKGTSLGIIGGTGCGKTSLINLIPRFYDPTSGTVKVNGTDNGLLSVEQLRKKVAVVYQKALLFSGTIRSNLCMGKADATDKEMDEALAAAQAAEIVASKGGLDAAVEPRGRNFSGGQKQRLTIARALVSRPEIIILDDSSSALDAATDAALRKSIASLPWSPTVLIVAQRVASVKDADRILVMDDGHIAGIGTHSYLLENCSQYREIVYSQNPEEAANEQ